MKKKHIYKFINILVLIVAALIFYKDYIKNLHIFANKNFISIFLLVCSVLLVHSIKAARLYLALYGTNISSLTFVKEYCKVTPIGVIYPLKLGEFFRMYCYGRKIKNQIKGTIIVLLDRFMDTFALVTIVLAVKFINGGTISYVIYMLLLFLSLMIIIYYVCPGILAFWKHYLLQAKATENKIKLLKFLETLHNVQDEIADITKGRGFLLYILSLAAWSTELRTVALIGDLAKNDASGTIINYLSSALGIGKSSELIQFIFTSVLLLFVVYIVISLYEKILYKK